MTDDSDGGTRSSISGGIQQGPVLQGRDIQVTFQVPAAAPVALAQLPPVVTGFTGRDDELTVLAELLDPAGAAGPVVVSAVAGLAGVGKTTLAVEAGHAARRRGSFDGGVLFIDLHGYDEAPVEPSQALDALLRALGVPAEHIPPGTEERAGLYRSVLAEIGHPVLVIADNASTEAQVRPLLPGTGPHRVVVTSRHTLAQLDARLIDVTVLDEEAGVELLDEALRAAQPKDDRISGVPQAAARLAGVCGGLPLALQITAALLKADPALSASELADELATESERLERLRYDDGGPGPHSVAAAFELSYRRLDDSSARVFRLLPVNPGPDVSTAAVAVLADLPVRDARITLGGLARAHLAEAAPGVAGRWRMHDLVLLYARRLSDSCADGDGREQARDRLLGHYLHTADAADDHLRALPGTAAPEEFIDRDSALAWLDAERPTLVAAVTMAANTGRDQVALRLPIQLAEYFQWRRHSDDLLATTAISLNAARRLSDRLEEAKALDHLGLALQQLRRFDEAIAAHQDAAAIFRETGDKPDLGKALGNLGGALREAERLQDAIAVGQEAVAIRREIGDRQGEGIQLSNLGLALQAVGQFDEAIAAHQDATAIHGETGDRLGVGIGLCNLGLALQEAGRFEEAIAADTDAAAIFRETGDLYGLGLSLINLGVALHGVGRLQEAIAVDRDAAAIFRETGDRHEEGMALSNLGEVLGDARDFEEAVAVDRDAMAIFRETGDRHGQDRALKNLEVAQAAQQT